MHHCKTGTIQWALITYGIFIKSRNVGHTDRRRRGKTMWKHREDGYENWGEY